LEYGIDLKRIKEVIVVEGRYDKNTVAQAVDAAIIETSGFRVFSDGEKLALLRSLADKRGLIVMTDSDSGGFFIRGRLRGILGEANVKHAYIPDVAGRERRKATSGKEGKLGVEGMAVDIIVTALERAGATFIEGPLQPDYSLTVRDAATHNHEDMPGRPPAGAPITKTDMFIAGLSGGAGSKPRRIELQKNLGLPEKLSANSLLVVLNMLYTRDEFMKLV